MGCCGKARAAVGTVKQITEGYVNLARGKDYEFTVARIKTCHKCDEQYWLGKRLFCSKCKCYIPAKARVKENTCPLKKWEQ